MFTKVIKKKGRVKTYFAPRTGTPSDKFFCVFEGSPESKAMLPGALFSLVEVGTSLEIEGELSSEGWINKAEVKSIGGTTTTTVPTSVINTSSSTTSTTTTFQSVEERIEVEVEYITKPKISKNGNEYVMAKFLKNQPVENVYIPIKAVPVTRHDEILGGFGTLDITGNRNSKGDTFFTSTIHDFKPTTKELSSEIEIKNCNFRLHYISFTDSNGNVVTIPQEEVPFGFSPVFEKVKASFTGSIKVIGSFKKTGNWKKNKAKKWELQTNWEDNGKITYDFSSIDVDSIKKIEEKHLQDVEYARILATLKQTKGFTSFSSIRGMFTSKGLNISTQQIEDLYWDEKYDREYYNVLKRKADEIFVSEEEFVFIIRLEGREHRVVERPVQNSATYIFNDTCEISQLLDRLRMTKKFDIIRDSEAENGIKLHTILGYVGRVVHQDYEGWLSKIQTHIGNGVERMLEDKFVF